MSVSQFKVAMQQCGAIPYRVGGRVRCAYAADTTEKVLEKMQKAVRVMAKHVSETLPEPDAEMKERWRKAQLRPLDICDEVCPEGVNLTQCPVEWLVERCARYHFDLSLTETNPPALKFVPHEGWELLDKTHWRGWTSNEPASLRAWQERTDALLQRSSPAFAVTTLGL